MSKKNNKSAASSLPTDIFTPSNASNIGLDGFSYDMTYGDGLEDKHIHNQSGGLSALPDGLVRSAKSPFDISGLIGVTQDENANFSLNEYLAESTINLGDLPMLSNLDWLSLKDDDDMGRMPHTPESIPELEAVWGENREPQRNQLRHDNLDLGDFHRTEGARVAPQSPEQHLFTIQALIRKASRRSASGSSLEQVINMVRWAAGEESPIIDRLTDDDGLAGKVFIRASAYPGCHNEKWSKHIKKVASSARYIIGSKKCGSCVHSGNNRCGVFKKRLVASVPWKEASFHYGKMLRASGVKVASGDPKESLRAALNSDKPIMVRSQDRRIQTYISDSVSLREASEALKNKAPRKEIDISHRAVDAEIKKASQEIKHWIDVGLLSKAEAMRISKSGATPREMIKAGARLASVSRKASQYSGEGHQYRETKEVPREDVISQLERVASSRRSNSVKLEEKGRKRAIKKIKKMASDGLITMEIADRIASQDRTGEQLLRLASHAVSKYSSTKHSFVAKSSRRQIYLGDGIDARYNPDNEIDFASAIKQARNASHHKEARPQDVKKVVKWASKQMSSGTAGEDLTGMLAEKFSGSLLRSASQKITSLRKKHEGLSGRVYVRASDYASDSGTSGCDEGASKYRKSASRYVLAMKRCGTCALRNREGMCQKYKKPLITRRALKKMAQERGQSLGDLQRKGIEEMDASLSGEETIQFNDSSQSILDDFGGLRPGDMKDIHFMNEPKPVDRLLDIKLGGMILLEDDE